MVYVLIVVALAIVALTAYSVGKDTGIEIGKDEILAENIVRINAQPPCMDADMTSLINNLIHQGD